MTDLRKCGCKHGVRGKNCLDYHASHYESTSAAKEDADALNAAERPEQTPETRLPSVEKVIEYLGIEDHPARTVKAHLRQMTFTETAILFRAVIAAAKLTEIL